MPIMPLRESHRGNQDKGKTIEEKIIDRKRKRNESEEKLNKSATTGSPSKNTSPNKNTSPELSLKDKSKTHKSMSRSSKRICPDHRSTSGSRAHQRSFKEFKKLKKCDQKEADRKESSRCKQKDSTSKCSSRKNSPHKNTSTHNQASQSSSTNGGASTSNNNNKNTNSSKPIILTDEDGHVIHKAGVWIDSRYRIDKLLGVGTFGKCFECYDKKYDRIVALKIIRSKRKYNEAAKLEIDTLRRIKRKDPDNKYFCIEMYGSFMYGGHVCISFPKLGKSVFDFMKENLFHPYPLSHVQQIAYQLLTAVKFLHRLRLTHTDLKPENMMFVDSSYTTYWSDNAQQDVRVLKNPDMRLIDFGSATYDNEHHSMVVSTRHYRAPEVVLMLGWSHSCDIWSCGCIIFELLTGNTFFQTHDDVEHLAMMERSLGVFPKHMIRKTSKKYFVNDRLDWDYKSEDGRYVEANCRSLKEHVMNSYRDRHNYRPMYDLLRRLLRYDPYSRITANDALRHPYFDEKYAL